MIAFATPLGNTSWKLGYRSLKSVIYFQSTTSSHPRKLTIRPSIQPWLPFVQNQKTVDHPSHLTSSFSSPMMTLGDGAESSTGTSSSNVRQPVQSLQKLIALTFYIGCWYAANILFNIYNKRVLKVFPLFATVTLVQFLMGSLVGLALWISGLHRFQKASLEDLKKIYPLALSHLIGNVLTNVSLRQVAVSFTHTIKAAEPFFSVALSKLFIPGTAYTIWVYLSLIPIVGGVTLASISEVSFNWIGFLTAMASNVAFQSRNVLSKKFMKGVQFDNLNLFAYISILSFVTMLPFTLLLEAGRWREMASVATHIGSEGCTIPVLLLRIAIAGFLHFLYNQFSYVVLKRVNPVTHSVGNTMKRVAVIVSSVIVFKNQVTLLNKIGTAIAIAGVAIYSQVKNISTKKKEKIE
ncbi:Phosphoenolpyruvate/phosphate translocator 2, chloroplastic [Galdieria sulphuraria]|uniref:Phosphoenolpyruvate/phosphate translocator n=1 Tax=Galdieria sulphuraria TaxID=130081 RepID=B5AJT0_GALSU|nr:sugar-phosphate:phosphate translocator, DMT family [Galdieria sulphuraria]ACF72678.1 phosphoenolpyruvate/phosphate translocator [Galdieria sulphuraria]EME27084.1 sugar-phosphate:phosphate translocator, DMT family [Galdieria sulphuraria]GJD05639.1 Phosphoenolpyruvate/phosphate translocator 2, chloroplastic [Galdieria sulphuraria]|eukprot:XP_005703604.1 sugar-phosphate:phosphate translocator, DMT family [Galdieria sulphuraria]